MKRTLSIILALMLCLSLCACGGSKNDNTDNNTEATTNVPETTMSKDDMLAVAEATNSLQIADDTGDNVVKAKQSYCGKILEVTGFVLSINEDHIELGADKSLAAPVIDVYLPTDDLVMLTQYQLVTIIGETSGDIYERSKSVMGSDVIFKYYEMQQAYIVESEFEVNVKLDINKYGGGTAAAEIPTYNGFYLKPFSTPGINLADYPKNAVTVVVVSGKIILDDYYRIEDYTVISTETLA